MLPHTILGLLAFGAASGAVGYAVIGGLHRAMDWLNDRGHG